MRNSSPFGGFLIAAPSWAEFLFRGARGGHGRRAVKAYGLFPARVGSITGDEDETELLTLDATPLIYALVNAVKELSARVAALEGKIGETKTA
jgi:hypothetical protein